MICTFALVTCCAQIFNNIHTMTDFHEIIITIITHLKRKIVYITARFKFNQLLVSAVTMNSINFSL